ncbi:MAG: hypothetical protein D6741_11910 [Planctomycetota bacterium]|nr:MAG: hypothetical protein D6741_11910 [Planctomycetota bacterium]
MYCVRAADGALCWRFKDLPDRLIGAYSRLESAWPVPGSVVVVNDTLYFAAGRSSYLDGGIFLYALDPTTGELRNSRQYYGPFSPETGFPIGGDAGFKNDVMVTDGTKLYLRHKAFDLDLNETEPSPHIVPTSNFLDGQPQHRTAWCFADGIVKRNAGDILAADGTVRYEVFGFPIYANHSYFDPRVNGYLLRASQTVTTAARQSGRGGESGGGAGRAKAIRKFRATVLPQGNTVWEQNIPVTGKALVATPTLVFVAGEPMKFRDHSAKTYAAAYAGELGSRLVVVSAADGKPVADYALDADIVWDGMAIAEGRLFVALKDGTVRCLGPR